MGRICGSLTSMVKMLNSVPACVRRRHFRCSIHRKSRYQSSSSCGRSASPARLTPSSLRAFAVGRSIMAQRSFAHGPRPSGRGAVQGASPRVNGRGLRVSTMSGELEPVADDGVGHRSGEPTLSPAGPPVVARCAMSRADPWPVCGARGFHRAATGDPFRLWARHVTGHACTPRARGAKRGCGYAGVSRPR